MAYNYEHFRLDEEELGLFEAFAANSATGVIAPDGQLMDARSGERVRLSELWAKRDLVLEFGSFT